MEDKLKILATSVLLKCAELMHKTKILHQLDSWCESEKIGDDVGCRPASCGQDIIATELIAALRAADIGILELIDLCCNLHSFSQHTAQHGRRGFKVFIYYATPGVLLDHIQCSLLSST